MELALVLSAAMIVLSARGALVTLIFRTNSTRSIMCVY